MDKKPCADHNNPDCDEFVCILRRQKAELIKKLEAAEEAKKAEGRVRIRKECAKIAKDHDCGANRDCGLRISEEILRSNDSDKPDLSVGSDWGYLLRASREVTRTYLTQTTLPHDYVDAIRVLRKALLSFEDDG